ncbi:MAG: prolipoprotein diacylglyceryl transferase [Fibrobacter sp.]|nr:prolipoprotein diacylglyceryl transferase [Fibrobacter sp.]
MAISIHSVFDITAITVGILAYVKCGKRLNIKERPIKYNLLIIAAILTGGGLFARLAVQFENGLPSDPGFIINGLRTGGKSVIAGFLGAIAGTKIIKLFLPRSTYSSSDQAIGDQVIIPFSIAQIIGRIGCFLSGVTDNTHGKPTGGSLGYDYGDGILRHPTQLYEIFFVAVSCAGILFFWKRLDRYGLRFQLFVFAYCFQRFIIEFYSIHPAPYYGLTVYQIISIAGMIWSFFLFTPVSSKISHGNLPSRK